jgi:hypothetical protein
MALPKFEDFKAPWEQDGAEKDADGNPVVKPEELKKHLYNLLTDKDKLQTKVAERDTKITALETAATEAARAGETASEKTAREVQEAINAAKAAQDAAKTSQRELQQQLAAARVGIPEEDAGRLQGETLEEMVADAKAMQERWGTPKKAEEGDGAGPGVRQQPRRLNNAGDPDPHGSGEASVDDMLKAVPTLGSFGF